LTEPDNLLERFTQDFHKKIAGRNMIEWGEYLYSLNQTAFPIDHLGTLYKLYSLFAYIEFPYMHIMGSQRNKGVINKLICFHLYLFCCQVIIILFSVTRSLTSLSRLAGSKITISVESQSSKLLFFAP
jgi:hypothetical protein